jgi:hypothetical protein
MLWHDFVFSITDYAQTDSSQLYTMVIIEMVYNEDSIVKSCCKCDIIMTSQIVGNEPHINKISQYIRSFQDSSVGIATDYRLDDWMIGVQFLVWAGNFSL